MAAPSQTFLFAENLNILDFADLAAATIKAALVTSAWTPDADESGNDLWADISANEIANGNGYTTGGVTLANKSLATIANGYRWTSDPITWTASGSGIPAHRYVVFYASGSLWGKTNPLLFYFLGDSAPADVPLTAAGNPLQYSPHATNGWITHTKA